MPIFDFITTQKVLESQSNDALGSLVLTVLTVLTVLVVLIVLAVLTVTRQYVY